MIATKTKTKSKAKSGGTPPPAKRPAHLAQGRWLGDFPDLSPAEERLVKRCAQGKVWEPEGWDGQRPAQATAANTIRAGLIRFLALGGDTGHPVHEKGVMVHGAWVEGELDLHQCRTAVRLDVKQSWFDQTPILMAAIIPELAFSGCRVPGLRADRLIVAGGAFFKAGFRSEGDVRLLGASIGGNFECRGSAFHSPGGNALNACGIRVRGEVFLDEGFEARGIVALLGAEISGNLVCQDGSFTNKGGIALGADGIVVKESLFLRRAAVDGAIILTAARIGELIDDPDCWKAGHHNLDGLRYDRIIGPTDSAFRIAWLNRQNPSLLTPAKWAPQPWEQLIKVLREMGHGYEAGEIAIAKQEHMRCAGIINGPLRRGFHWLYGLLAGYGHRPARTISAMITMWLAAAFFFQIGGSYGYMGPATPLLNNADLSPAVAQQCGHRFDAGTTPWTRCKVMPPEYTTFQPLLYSLDLILPLVDLQQEADWAPIVEDPERAMPFGAFLRWLMWSEILFGWAMSLMLVAVLGRLVEKD